MHWTWTRSIFICRYNFLQNNFYLDAMRIVDDIEQQIQQSEFLTILIQAMKSIGESRMTDHHRTVINGLLQKNLPIDTFEQDFKVAPIWVRKTIWNIANEIE